MQLPRPGADQIAKLNAMAASAYEFSGEVAFYGNGGIVLEIRGSLALFGGMQEFLRRARSAFTAVEAHCVFGLAATPRAASWLAHHCPGRHACFGDELPAALRALPIAALAHEEKLLLQLERNGIRTLGALMRLPRAGVARRFGPDLLRTLDQALGRSPEPLAWYVPPQSFDAAEELPLPASDWPRLAPLAEKLLRRLEHYLLRRQAATQQVRCRLRHRREPATVLEIGLSRHERRAVEFLDLLQEHFERTALPAEVTALGIHCSAIHALPAENLQLLDGRAEVAQRWAELVDRLAARLGGRHLRRLEARADHRPERRNGVRSCDDARKSGSDCNFRRRNGSLTPIFVQDLTPCWLLPRPEPLREEDRRPCWDGALELSRLPERIEQGWWDGEDVRRDYYLARNPRGSRLWVYRDRRDRCWYLHGVFA